MYLRAWTSLPFWSTCPGSAKRVDKNATQGGHSFGIAPCMRLSFLVGMWCNHLEALESCCSSLKPCSKKLFTAPNHDLQEINKHIPFPQCLISGCTSDTSSLNWAFERDPWVCLEIRARRHARPTSTIDISRSSIQTSPTSQASHYSR